MVNRSAGALRRQGNFHKIRDGSKPGFKAKLFKKDLGIAMNTLAENGVPAATSAVVQQLVQAQIAAGEGEEDYSGLAKAIFKLANL